MGISTSAGSKSTASEASQGASLSLVHTRIFAVAGRLLAQRSSVTSLDLDSDLREVGLSSIDMVNLVLSIEEEFDLAIPEAEITSANLRSVAAISRLVEKLSI